MGSETHEDFDLRSHNYTYVSRIVAKVSVVVGEHCTSIINNNLVLCSHDFCVHFLVSPNIFCIVFYVMVFVFMLISSRGPVSTIINKFIRIVFTFICFFVFFFVHTQHSYWVWHIVIWFPGILGFHTHFVLTSKLWVECRRWWKKCVKINFNFNFASNFS